MSLLNKNLPILEGINCMSMISYYEWEDQKNISV